MSRLDGAPGDGSEFRDGAISRRPGISGTPFWVGVAAAVVTITAVASYSWLAAATACVGTLCLVLARYRATARLVQAGASGLAAATILAGVEGAPPLAVGVGAWSALVAWDATTYGASVVATVGSASTTGVQLRHVRTGVLVGGVGLALGAISFLAGARAPVAVGALAVVAGLGFVLALGVE